jgi:peptidoglycan hydrolase-like protein with peptidoglycan-binding domain
VEDLQKAAGLPVTGLVDQVTRAALDQAVAGKGQDAAADEQIEATSVQTTLKLAGYWDGQIDGQWSPELTAALKQFQKALGVPPTGAVDAATLAALEAALAAKSPSAEPTASPGG